MTDQVLFSGPDASPGVSGPAVELETRTCPECGEQITAAKAGRNSIGWRMGTHRRVKHGVQGAGKSGRATKPKPGAPTEEELADRPVLSVIKSAASEISGRGTKRAPTIDDLAKASGQAVSMLSIAGASFAVETDPAIPDTAQGEQLRSELVDYLTLDRETADGIMRPIAKAFAPTKLNQKYGRQIVDNVEVVGSVADLGMWLMHWRRYMRMRGNPVPVARQLYAVPDQPAQMPAPTEAPAAGVTTPGPQEGRVITAEDVAAMQRNRSPQ